MEPRINERKSEAVGRIKETLGGARDIIFTDYRGLTVEQITDLRDKLRESATAYKVVKNDYARIAMKQLGMPDASSLLAGPTALALVGRDVGPVAKVILDFTKDSPLQLKGALVGGRLFGAWMGLVVGGMLIHLTLRRRRDDYEADRGACLACGRCYDYCPVELTRRKKGEIRSTKPGIPNKSQ